mmetsp:Transcript_5123/g.10394  ORF Transcript_5123/g.10394 Transcript_5123/m.10394 type:complete len:108 (+) Transcript_5123:2835-3158(+)
MTVTAPATGPRPTKTAVRSLWSSHTVRDAFWNTVKDRKQARVASDTIIDRAVVKFDIPIPTAMASSLQRINHIPNNAPTHCAIVYAMRDHQDVLPSTKLLREIAGLR